MLNSKDTERLKEQCYQQFLTMLKQTMQDQSLNQSRLAKHLGVSRAYVSVLLNGKKRNPSLQTLVALAMVCNSELLLDFVPVKKRKK